MKVRFYKTTKRVNSTYVPTSYTEYDCQFKDNCAITAPQITLSTFTDYNYCYIPDFGRYYFVTSCIVETGRRYTYTLAVDVLATYKTQILSESTYVKRSASDYDLNLVDDTWIHNQSYTENVVTASNGSISETGIYLITVVNKNNSASANPASTMYAITAGQLATFLASMFDLEQYTEITDLEATYFNPYQYITSCKWLPIDSTLVSGSDDYIQYGWYERTDIFAKRVTSYGTTLTWSITVPSGNDWTWESSDWTHHLLYIPFCGEIDIDPIYSGKTLTITQYIDFNTGGANTVITDGSNKIISAINGQAGAEVAISQVSAKIDIPTNKAEAVQKGVKALGAMFSKDKGGLLNFGKSLVNAIGTGMALSYGQTSVPEAAAASQSVLDAGSDIVGTVADGISVTLMNPTVSVSGADGARYTNMHRTNVIIYTRHYNRYVDTHNFIGGMCCQILTLSNLSGFTQLGNGMFEINALDEEKSAIRQITENGFYIE